ncbi:MAG: LysM peptidoglycan-binding domain-containing protein [Proteobacteria bacterium]|nr:LysM peptidoglycan-binding domain-containing protein [Pseudomonadota bacterium]
MHIPSRFSALLAVMLLWGSTSAWANEENAADEAVESQSESENDGLSVDEAEETDMDADLIEDVMASEAPEGSADYEEMHQMRILERTFLPSHAAEQQSVSGTSLPPGNLMELSHDTAMHVLTAGSGQQENQRGLQRQASKLMKEAMTQVRKQIEANGSKLDMPFGIDCIQQPAVQEHIAMFTAPASGTMKTWLKRLGKWRKILEKALIAEDVPTDFIYLAMIESGFKTRVKSPAAAAGMWQFMAGTGVEMGLTINEYVDERFDPVKAAHAAAKYLKKQFARYHAWPLAMAAYNGGPGTVNVAIDRYNTNDYFKLVKYGAMYDETRKYVPRILAAAIIGRNPAAFGFDGLTPEPEFVFDSVDVPEKTQLKVLAEAAGCSVDTLKELNPELLKDITPPGSNYALRIPKGKYHAFVESFDRVKKKYDKADETIVLKFGETLEILGADIGVPARVLRNLNGIGSRENAVYGSEIIVPNGSKRGHAEKNKNDDDLPVVLVSPEKFQFSDKKRVFYETQKGDTLKAIAAAFGVMPNQLAIWNELDIWAKLRPQMELQIYIAPQTDLSHVRHIDEEEVHVVARGSDEHQEIVDARKNARNKAAKSAAKSKGKSSSGSTYVTHKVGKGDSLSKIAKKYGVSVESLLKLNKLKKNSTLRKGQVLKIKKR